MISIDNYEQLLGKFGLNSKESKVYLTLLSLGPTSIRQLAHETKINRGSVYDSLKKLSQKGLTTRSQGKKQNKFVAENPEVLKVIFKDERRKLVALKKQLLKIVPQFQNLYIQNRRRPIIKIYEGYQGTRFILEDLLRTMADEKNKEYRVYSSADIRNYLYHDFASFSDRRIAAGIKVKTIALGSGGELRGLDERLWLSKKTGAPAYMMIYANKFALISLERDNNPVGVIVEDNAIAQTQKLIFDNLWAFLK